MIEIGGDSSCPRIRPAIKRALDDVPDFDAQPALAHYALIMIANSVIDMAEGERRNLNDWEKACLVGAISALAIGWLPLAYTDLDLAVTDPRTVAPDAVSRHHAADLARIDVPQMRRALAHLAGMRPWERPWNHT